MRSLSHSYSDVVGVVKQNEFVFAQLIQIHSRIARHRVIARHDGDRLDGTEVSDVQLRQALEGESRRLMKLP